MSPQSHPRRALTHALVQVVLEDKEERILLSQTEADVHHRVSAVDVTGNFRFGLTRAARYQVMHCIFCLCLWPNPLQAGSSCSHEVGQGASC